MKKFLLIITLASMPLCAFTQKTTRETISNARGVSIIRTITDSDTLYIMSGQNAKYTHLVDIVTLKYGSPVDINNLLTECMKFLPEKNGNSLDFAGNTIMSMGNNRLMLFGTGRDQLGYVLLNKSVITKLQTDLAAHL